MDQSLLVVGVICIGIFVGVTVPALLQLRRTLRSAEVFLETTGATLRQTLEDVSDAAEKLNQVAGRIDENAETLRSLFNGLGSVAGLLGRLRELLHGNKPSSAEAGSGARTEHTARRGRRRRRVEQPDLPKRSADG
jgi:ABC-type transporter Mla subunit MlaD